MRIDRERLGRRLRGGRRRRGSRGQRSDAAPLDQNALTKIAADIDAAVLRSETRKRNLPKPTLDADLPIIACKDEIMEAIRSHQVIVICGETGSGKTTQLPQICLELGRGVDGLIGHTQPRRIAARTVAARIAEELGVALGQQVGYKIRFGDKTSDHTHVKVMTDGILLAEMQGDRALDRYDTLIIDEAHERSLNIDFILGCLHRLRAKRPDLKIIITSATIDPGRFSEHFENAPIIEVSGRTYPVEVRYRSLPSEADDEPDRDLVEGIIDGVDELCREGPGDILVFLSGEREIREAAKALRQHVDDRTEILPLYARLSAAEQNRAFQTHHGRRIVLATNVAETSLTVPGIRYVIDSGLARISRYSVRSKVQRLPIEAISKASAEQRKGRCGRVAPGICIRLYAESDFEKREEFTPAEILRTNLASVILQMSSLRLGQIETFPFLDPPRTSMIRDGYHTLHELGAIDESQRLTQLGHKLARLPIDPRIARMVLAGAEESAITPLLIIGAALSIPDPRERPMDKRDAADQAHLAWKDDTSDFLALINLWDQYHEQRDLLSRSQLRKWCKSNFVSYMRMREWCDIRLQLKSMMKDLGHQSPSHEQDHDADAIHRALLTGLLGNIGRRDERTREYEGAHNVRFLVFPGSGLSRKGPKWLVAAELVETSRLFARTVGRVQPEWIERAAEHIVNRSYSEPMWNEESGHVMATEKVSLYGLEIIKGRRKHYGSIDPKAAREMFIQAGLVEGTLRTKAAFMRHNLDLLAEIEDLEAKTRRRDLLADMKRRYEFFDRLVPKDVCNGPQFERWRKKAERESPRLLFLSREDLLAEDADAPSPESFPDRLQVNEVPLPLKYRLDPGRATDGVTITVPIEMLNQLEPSRVAWLVPGMVEEKILGLLRSLPKGLRTRFLPAREVAAECAARLTESSGDLLDALGGVLRELTGVDVSPDAWRPETLPDHLNMNIKVVDEKGKTLATGRDLDAIKRQLAPQVGAKLASFRKEKFNRDHVTRWDFDTLPESVEIKRAGITIRAYPTIIDKGDHAALRLLESKEAAKKHMRDGLRCLFRIEFAKEIEFAVKHLPRLQSMCLCFADVGSGDALRTDLLNCVVDRAFLGDDVAIRNEAAFRSRGESGHRQIGQIVHEVGALAASILKTYQDLCVRLDNEQRSAWMPTLDDIDEQLAHLVYKGFLTETPARWLPHFPRYLTAIERRLRKLENAGLERDRETCQRFRQRWDAYTHRVKINRKREIVSADLDEYRWWLEEYRVSLFAQELKTSIPMSEKRLDALWAKVIA